MQQILRIQQLKLEFLIWFRLGEYEIVVILVALKELGISFQKNKELGLQIWRIKLKKNKTLLDQNVN